MYQIHADIFKKLSLYVQIIRQFKEDINEVHVNNSIEELFGKTYCRVYITIRLKEDSKKQYDLYESIRSFFRYGEKEYFSFYLGAKRYEKNDDVHYLDNIEEKTHYDYIWNLLEWFLEKNNVRIVADRFVSERELRKKEENRMREVEKHWNRIEVAVADLTPKEGQLIAIKQWESSPMRIGIATKVILPSRRQPFSMNLSEIKKDLSLGKVTISYVPKREIYAIIQPDLLSRKITKTELIALIEKNETFNGLIWRRSQEFWN